MVRTFLDLRCGHSLLLSSQDRAAGLLPIPPRLSSAILKLNRPSTVSVTPQRVLLSFLILAEISNFTVLILVQLNLAFSSFRLCHESNSKKEKKMSAGFRAQGRKEGGDGAQLPLPSESLISHCRRQEVSSLLILCADRY